VITTIFFAFGVSAALTGVWMGWVLAAFMTWTAATLLRRMRRTGPVLTVDARGVHDHRVPMSLGWDRVASMRTVDRRVVFSKVPLLELVPAAPVDRDRGILVRAVLRGDLSFVDARDRSRLMFDLRHLDVTPEEVLAAAREHRAGWTPAPGGA